MGLISIGSHRSSQGGLALARSPSAAWLSCTKIASSIPCSTGRCRVSSSPPQIFRIAVLQGSRRTSPCWGCGGRHSGTGKETATGASWGATACLRMMIIWGWDSAGLGANIGGIYGWKISAEECSWGLKCSYESSCICNNIIVFDNYGVVLWLRNIFSII